jgi:hypothetical protein
MSTFSVYLFVRAAGEADSTSALRRLQAVQALRDELVSLGVTVSAVPNGADLSVEITNVFGTTEDSRPSRRVVVVRIAVGDERMDFVCSDGIGRGSAERHAAKRIMVWLDSLYHQRAEATAGWRDLTPHISSES